ncbi:MAG TPA: hypothetical protein VHR97_00610 [Candidatus Baltobacteraceae bacterium]|nr:hypothetical protein [Candidatus Baltobacteraceae bacterium]
MSADVILLPEVRARLALGNQHLHLHLLAPLGSWIGCGTLRVLRLKINEDRSCDLTVGYESYRPVGGA